MGPRPLPRGRRAAGGLEHEGRLARRVWLASLGPQPEAVHVGQRQDLGGRTPGQYPEEDATVSHPSRPEIGGAAGEADRLPPPASIPCRGACSVALLAPVMVGAAIVVVVHVVVVVSVVAVIVVVLVMVMIVAAA